MKNILYCYRDGYGNEITGSLGGNPEGRAGYEIEENAVRVWESSLGTSKTMIFPLERVIYIRETEEVEGDRVLRGQISSSRRRS